MDSWYNADFDRLKYQRVDFEYVAGELRRTRLRLRLASTPLAAEQAVYDMQAALRLYRTHSALARIRHDLRSDDPYYAGEQAYYDQADAQISLQVQSFYTTLLNSRHRADLEAKFGRLIIRKAENLKDIIRPAAVENVAEENRLQSAYQQMVSTATVVVDSQILPLTGLGPLLQSPDRITRALAHRAETDWYQDHSEDLDDLFDQLVNARSTLSRKVGFRSFADLAYRRLERFDYSRVEVETLRRSVVRYIVPLTSEIRYLQRRRLGLDRLYYYDLPCYLPSGNPRVLLPLDHWPAACEQILAEIAQKRLSFFQDLINRSFFDLGVRANKVPGSSCSTIINAGLPFILMNASGTACDVSTLFHTAGHAYGVAQGLKDVTLLEYLQPASDVGEIHATAMEYLSYPYLEMFFGNDALDYTMMHMSEVLLMLPYWCMVDEFQHAVYDRANLTASERRQIWRELQGIYQPDLDYDQEPYHAEGNAWQKDVHIYVAPFHSFDYVLSHLAALDIWQVSLNAPDDAWRMYEKLCGLGGRDTFAGLLEKSDIASPFDHDTIKRLAYAASNFLDL
ncbi:MAG: M3 family metallopeptidase [Saccharofermentanales bacterium]|nr:M3 family oligoendopeptidase [Clostridiaceae bacterium]